MDNTKVYNIEAPKLEIEIGDADTINDKCNALLSKSFKRYYAFRIIDFIGYILAVLIYGTLINKIEMLLALVIAFVVSLILIISTSVTYNSGITLDKAYQIVEIMCFITDSLESIYTIELTDSLMSVYTTNVDEILVKTFDLCDIKQNIKIEGTYDSNKMNIAMHDNSIKIIKS